MIQLKTKLPISNTGIEIPPVIFGTSYLGNLYREMRWDDKMAIMKAWFEYIENPVTIDTAGKYGAGLALEAIGKGLGKMQIAPENITISNKLGWYRVPLVRPEPSFEPGIWAGIQHDAIQKISYKGILECWEQGLELLGGNYQTRILSVHDPDEYIATAATPKERGAKINDVIEAYHALMELKAKGKADAIGIGSKVWKVSREIMEHVDLDWVMLAINFTIMEHRPDLVAWLETLASKNIAVINSAVFHGGFLTGGDYYNYHKVDRKNASDAPLFHWRDQFFNICQRHRVHPADACIKFGLSHPAIISLALNTSRPEKIPENIALLNKDLPDGFFNDMKNTGLIDMDYKYI